MMYVLTPIPIPLHPFVGSDEVLLWAMIAFQVALVVLATTLWIIGSRRVQQKQASKDVPQQAATLEPEKVLLPR